MGPLASRTRLRHVGFGHKFRPHFLNRFSGLGADRQFEFAQLVSVSPLGVELLSFGEMREGHSGVLLAPVGVSQDSISSGLLSVSPLGKLIDAKGFGS